MYNFPASERPVCIEELLQASNVTNAVLTELERLGCIEMVDGNVRLIERAFISNKECLLGTLSV